MQEAAAIRPAATVILLRDGEQGLEVFLMERSRNVGFMASAWVFPGGRVDKEDEETPAVGGDFEQVKRSFWVAAARELGEEAGVWLKSGAGYDVSGMRIWSHWLTPPFEPRRYDTWFFAIALPEGAVVQIDGNEAVAGVWIRPEVGVEESLKGERMLAPPTFRTLFELAAFATVADALKEPRTTPLLCPMFLQEGEDWFALLPGDPDFPLDDPSFEAAALPPTRFPIKGFLNALMRARQ
jgi:8-oxo-dGTP pyrophosphatase MutT (NUDIX family)